jgi:hypothetical protein
MAVHCVEANSLRLPVSRALVRKVSEGRSATEQFATVIDIEVFKVQAQENTPFPTFAGGALPPARVMSVQFPA